ncbi:hypothetical protein [Aquirhabdus parva]|uniref:GTPase n=1 Tax=Aquirhabdus parva TaxID=2283318 RepID=A0A345P570_9GAMM|nr:hypothetical protein [Aquirhabdus parva]AXI02429.1 hypothetical protein HYN46_06035 [Aquirhabdus parva]
MNLNIIKLLNAELPPEEVTHLSLVGATKSEMQTWVASLSMLNVGETAKQLYITLQELLAVEDIPDPVRYELMEVLRPAIYTIIESLSKHYINQNVLLDQRAERIAGLAQQLRVYSAMVYRGIALRTAENYQAQNFGLFAIGKKKSMLQLIGQATHRGLTEFFRLLAESKLLYLPIYKGMWLRLHELFNLAEQFDLGSFSLRDENQIYGKALTIQQAYLRSIFMSTCNTNKLRQAEIKKISQLSEIWVDLLKISAAPSQEDLFLVDTAIDAPPMYITELKEITPEMFYIDARPLLAHFENLNTNDPELLNPAEETLLSATLKLHLLHTLKPPMERSSERHPRKGTVYLSLGLIGTHYQTSGQQNFETVIQNQQLTANTPHPGISNTFQIDSDVIYTAQEEQIRQNATREYLESYECQIVNISMGGYCIRWQGTTPSVLRSGELIAVREHNSSTWSIGLIRWVQQHLHTGAEFGVEILSQQGKACGARVIRQDGYSSEYMRTLLLPEVKEQNRATTIITPTLAFRSGHKISIRLGSEEVRAQLTRELVITQSFSQFEFVLLQSLKDEQTKSNLLATLAGQKAEQKKAAKSNAQDEFDEVWNTL